MDTEGRLTRSRARTMATPLAAPLDAEPRRTITKKAAEQLPRVALFDQTNVQAVQEKVQVKVEQGEMTDDGLDKAGDIPLDIKADGQQEVPFEDNIIAQLLCEYQDTLEDEMHITPARAQPQAPPVVVSVTDVDDQAPASTAGLPVSEAEGVELEMLLTPERLETVPTKAAQEDATQGSAAKGTPLTLAVEAPPAQAEGSAEAGIVVQATVTETTPKPQEVEGERWNMDGTPNIKPLKAPPPAVVAPMYARLKSAVKLTSSYDHRSLRQMKQDLKAAAAPKLAGLAGASSGSASTAYTGAVCGAPAIETEEASSDLCDALGSLHIAAPRAGKELLRGLPVPEGSHVRFDEAGESCESTPSARRTLLRGLPAPTGAHVRFD